MPMMFGTPSLTNTLLDLIVFLTNLMGFHRLDMMAADGYNFLMSMYLIHRILEQLAIWAAEYSNTPVRATPDRLFGLGTRPELW